jgi:hypothetical protein
MGMTQNGRKEKTPKQLGCRGSYVEGGRVAQDFIENFDGVNI